MYRWLLLVGLLCLGSGRMLFLVGHTPVLGYANNYDMIRLQACHQIWPRNAEPGQLHLKAPLEYYQFQSLDLGQCFLSSELLFTSFTVAYLHWRGKSTDTAISIRVFGFTRAIFLILIAFAFSVFCAWYRQWLAAFGNALVYALILTDPANTLFLNTFYTEFSSLFFFYATLLSLYLYGHYPQKNWPVWLLAVGFLGLGFSKPQHFLLPFLLLITLGLVMGKQIYKKKLLLPVLVVIGILGYQSWNLFFNPQMQYIRSANTTNMFLGAVLPAASQPANVLRQLNLPADCLTHQGKTWYTINQNKHPCPAVLAISRWQIFYLMMTDPPLLWRLTQAGVNHLRPWALFEHPYPDDRLQFIYGHVAGQSSQHVSHYLFTLSYFLKTLPNIVMLLGFFLPALLAIGLWQQRRYCIQSELVVLLSLVITLYTVFFTALLGDGLIEFSKHTHLFFTSYLAIIVLLGLASIRKLLYFYQRSA